MASTEWEVARLGWDQEHCPERPSNSCKSQHHGSYQGNLISFNFRMFECLISIAAIGAERALAEKPHPEMGYRSCLGIIRLTQQYSA